MPGDPPKSHSMAMEINATPTPVSTALEKWSRTRDESMLALLDVISPEKVCEVMEALYSRALGMELTQDVVTKSGEKVTLRKFIPPNVNAAKLFLSYAIGGAEKLGGEGGRRQAPVMTPETIAELMAIGERNGANLRFVKQVEREVVNGEGREIIEEGGQLVQTVGTV